MRALIIAGALLALTGCGNNDQADNTANLDENLTAENMVTNDVTAIDAVTADSANMAADVNYTDELDANLSNAMDKATRPSASGARPKPKATTSSPAPAENSAAPATNAAQ